MKIYGLTGKTGAGKSTVSKILSEKGFFVIDGDLLARKITEKGSPVLFELAKVFGEDIIDEEGCLIRRLLAKKAFSSKEGTDNLNRITHGAIHKEIEKEIEKGKNSGFEKCVIDAAALLESPSRGLCEKMIVVTAPEEIRLERILERDCISKEEALTRIKAQKSDEYYLESADIIIRNFEPYNICEELSKVE